MLDDQIHLLWATDMHVAVDNTAPTPWLIQAVADCNSWLPTAFICTGDIANATLAHLIVGMNIMRNARVPLIVVIGNHDENENDLGIGNLNTAAVVVESVVNMTAPFYRATTLTSGDGTVSALVLTLDTNFHNDARSAGRITGNRVGWKTSDIPGGYLRQFGTTQLDWVAAQIAASDADFVVVAMHYPPVGVVDSASLADVLQAAARPTIGLCGHNHPHGEVYALTSTDTLATYDILKSPGMEQSGAWTRLSLALGEGVVTVAGAVVQNYTDPGGWTIGEPFTVAV